MSAAEGGRAGEYSARWLLTHLWDWGAYRATGYVPRVSDARDRAETLGMRPVAGRTYHSTPPVPPHFLDISRAFAALRAFGPRLPRWAPYSLAQLCIWAYYVEGYGARGALLARTFADPLLQAEEDERVRLLNARNERVHGRERQGGDYAVARVLHCSERTAWTWRTRGIAAMARYLGGADLTAPAERA